MLIDKFGRQITYARISVTDRCNLRCFYCMPAEGIDYAPRNEILSYEEIIQLVKVLASKGVNKVRITGGEPFARRDLIHLLTKLKNIDGIDEVHVTTNAVLIHPYINQLKSIGINSINVSLDTLDEQRFFEITRRDKFEIVFQNLLELVNQGIPTKVNMVVMKGKNEQDILPMAELTRELAISVRYIEEMPFNGSGSSNKVLTQTEILKVLSDRYVNLIKLTDSKGSTSANYKIESATGDLGIIAAYTRTFCNDCNRIRFTSKGELRNCLYDETGFNIKPFLNGKYANSRIFNELQNHLNKKLINGFAAESKRNEDAFESMSLIGG